MAGTDGADDEAICVEDILDELYSQFVLLPVQPGEFSKSMFAKRHGLTTGATEAAFERMLASGQVELVVDGQGQPVQRNVKGHPSKVYRRLKN